MRVPVVPLIAALVLAAAGCETTVGGTGAPGNQPTGSGSGSASSSGSSGSGDPGIAPGDQDPLACGEFAQIVDQAASDYQAAADAGDDNARADALTEAADGVNDTLDQYGSLTSEVLLDAIDLATQFERGATLAGLGEADANDEGIGDSIDTLFAACDLSPSPTG